MPYRKYVRMEKSAFLTLHLHFTLQGTFAKLFWCAHTVTVELITQEHRTENQEDKQVSQGRLFSITCSDKIRDMTFKKEAALALARTHKFTCV